MEGDSIPRSMIYAQVEPEYISDVHWFIEGCEELVKVGVVDASTGILKFFTNSETYDDMLNIIERMPFKVNLLDSFVDQ